MAHSTITREEFDERLAQSTERMRQKRLILEEQVAVLEEAVAMCSAYLERLEAGRDKENERQV